MMTKEFIGIPKPEWDKQKARATLMVRAIFGLAIALVLIVALLIEQGYSKAELEEINEGLLQYIASQNHKRIQEERAVEQEPTPASSPAPAVQSSGLVGAEYLGEYTITYYCPCEKCCGEYGANRPMVNNKPVVTTSTGAFAQEGITIAVDPSIIPYGSMVYVDGIGYRIAQDCGGAIKGNRIDVYVSSHQEAMNGGKHKSKAYIIRTGGTEND